jgi:MFS family permease
VGPRYKWIALSNTTLGMLMATINSSIVLIALPDIFRGIGINPLAPANTSYLLWMIMGFLVVTAVLVVGFGRLGDMYGRVRMYNLGFAVFAVSSVLLAITWMQGDAAALWLIGWRVVQGIGGAFLMANSSAILTDAFPVDQRGLALGINGVAAIAGSFFGLVIGGLLGPLNWHLIFLVSVPFGVFGTIWAYLKLRDTGERKRSKMDWWGNITFAVGLIAVLVGITYGIQPYGEHVMGWTSPTVLTCLIGGVAVLVAFVVLESRVANPLFRLSLFRLRAFSLGNIANLLSSLGRGGLQFMLIIWLQGIWLPQHGYSFVQTPLWAGIYMLPLTIGFLVSAPLSGVLSDRMGARWFTTGGMVVVAASFVLLEILPVNFNYWGFAALLLLNGVGMGFFSSPNRADMMNNLPADSRGAGAGMIATFQNAAMVLSIGFFFSLMIAGLATHLPSVLHDGLVQHAVPAAAADRIAALPPVGVLFAAFLGYNPLRELLGNTLHQLPADQASFLTGRGFFPHLISGPFADGLTAAFGFAVVASLVAAIASWLCGPGKRAADESVGAELAAVAAESGTIPGELVAPSDDGVLTISGSVRMAGGTPVAGAVLTVTGQDGRQLARLSADDLGGYAVRGLQPGTYTVIATAPGMQPIAMRVMTGQEDVRRDFVLPGGGAVSGVVRSAGGGHGLADAAVVAFDSAGHLVASTQTAAGGGFLLSALPAGHITITAERAGYRLAALAVQARLGESQSVDLMLAPKTGLYGRVAGPDRAPVASATVSVRDATGTVVATTRTDPDGGYEVDDLPPGDYQVVAYRYEPALSQVDLRAGGYETVDLELGAGLSALREAARDER